MNGLECGTWAPGSAHAEEAGKTDVQKAIEESRWLEMDIRSKTEQVENLREAAGRITSVIAQGGGKDRGRHDAMEKAVVSMVDLEKEISGEICHLMEVRRQLMALFSRLTNQAARSVLQLRYLNRKSWQEIADRMDCSIHTAYRIHREGMRELSKLQAEDGAWNVCKD